MKILIWLGGIGLGIFAIVFFAYLLPFVILAGGTNADYEYFTQEEVYQIFDTTVEEGAIDQATDELFYSDDGQLSLEEVDEEEQAKIVLDKLPENFMAVGDVNHDNIANEQDGTVVLLRANSYYDETTQTVVNLDYSYVAGKIYTGDYNILLSSEPEIEHLTDTEIMEIENWVNRYAEEGMPHINVVSVVDVETVS